MRCTRCDGLSVPQAVGRAPDGRLVFGWCLTCLRETGCMEIEIAEKRPIVFHPRMPEPIEEEEVRPASSSRALVGRRARFVVAFALVLIVWGLTLIAAAVTTHWKGKGGTASPLGNGTPALLLVGGALTSLVGVGVIVVLSWRSLPRLRHFAQRGRWKRKP